MRNVELSQCDVFLPVYQVESIVSYQAIRKPTVFEKLILSLCVEHQKELSQYNLIQICKVLKIEQAFLKKSLDNLVDNDMLERNSQDLSDIYINILRLTNLGRDLYRRNEMPSNSKNVSIPFFYNPLLEKLVEKKNSWFTDVQAKKHIFQKRYFQKIKII
jgi:DNA-binding MarR family transcriptional regulator